MGWTIHKITKVTGVADQYGYDVTVSIGAERLHRRFQTVGEGGPILMMWDAVDREGYDYTAQVWIDRDVTARCGGTLSPEWVRRFFQ